MKSARQWGKERRDNDNRDRKIPIFEGFDNIIDERDHRNETEMICLVSWMSGCTTYRL
jgi:hypothetical protein